MATTAVAQDCVVDPKATQPGLHPNPLPNGRINELYFSTSVTAVFLPDTSIEVRIPVLPAPLKLDITFTEYVLTETGGLPIGMSISLNSCNKPGCKYTLPDDKSGCLIIDGTPEEFGLFSPTITATVDGSFIMPQVPIPVPGLPPAGTKVILSQAPQAFATFLRPLRQRSLTTSLMIEREQGTGCTPDQSFTEPGLYVTKMEDGLVNVAYPTTNLTAVFPQTQTFKVDTQVPVPNSPVPLNIPIRANFTVNYSVMKIESAGGTPLGMDIDLSTCNMVGCQYNLAAQLGDRACFEIKGTPQEDGDFQPEINISATGTFKMPKLSGLPPIPIPGLPREGEEVSITEPPAILAPVVEQFRTLAYKNNLTIKPDPNAPVRCTPESNTPSEGGLYPTSLPNGKVNVAYAKTKLTMFFPADTLVKVDTTITIPGVPIPIPVKADFDVKFTTYQVENVVGLPAGMNIDLASCSRTNCLYRMPNYQRGCIEMDGTPTEAGLFRPGVVATADGSFIMPDLGAIKQFAGDLIPPPGTKVILSEASPALQFFLRGIRNRTLQTRLRIEPEQYTPLCQPSVNVMPGYLRPYSLADGKKDEAYAATDLVYDFPKATILPLPPPVGLVQVKYTSFNIDSTGGLPAGMRFTGYCKPNNDCLYRLNDVDTAQNRVCFQLSGTPTEGGIFNPRLIASSTGIVTIFGNSFPLDRIPQQVPENVRQRLDSLRTIRFGMQLRIRPLVGMDDKLTADRIGLSFYPNPTKAGSELQFTLPQSSAVEVTVTDISGRVLMRPNVGTLLAGTQNLYLSAEGLASGLYFVRLSVDGKPLTVKWSVMK